MKSIFMLATMLAASLIAFAQQRYPLKIYLPNRTPVTLGLFNHHGQRIPWQLVPPITQDSVLALVPAGKLILGITSGNTTKELFLLKRPGPDTIYISHLKSNK